MNNAPTKRLWARWVGWFFLVNTFLCFLIQTTYIHFLTNLHNIEGSGTTNTVFAWVFLFASYLAHATVLNYVSAAVVLLLSWLFPRRLFVLLVGACVGAALIIAHLVDRIAYSIFHMHNLAEAWTILTSGTLPYVIPLSLTETALLFFVIIVVVLVELGLGYVVMRLLEGRSQKWHGYKVASFLVTMIAFSYISMAATLNVLPVDYRFSEANQHLILRMARSVPYFYELYTAVIPSSKRETVLVRRDGGASPLLINSPNQPLHYPLAPLKKVTPKAKPNVLFIIVDTWRYQQMNKTIMPQLAKFAGDSWQFEDHWSGGNCTKTGIFSLFYGLPGNYWDAMEAQHQGPLLISALKKAGYQFGIFASAPLTFPEFNKTVFHDVANLKLFTNGDSTPRRDAMITQEFSAFLNQRDSKRPFFSLVFYDGLHNYCEGSEWRNQSPFLPAVHDCARFSLTNDTNPTPYINRYRNAAHVIDTQIGKVLADLRASGQLDNTIVIITGDHGTEFNDNRLGYWSHASAYNAAQVHVPFIVHWPGKQPKQINYLTTHLDVAPTLLRQVLGVTNPMSDYSLGHSLFMPGNRPYLLASSYNDYAVITQQGVTRIFAGGDYTLNDVNGRPKHQATLNPQLMKKAYADLTKFYKRES